MNRNYGKLENGAITYSPDTLYIDGRLILAPRAEHFASAGWLPVTDTHPAQCDGFYAVPTGLAERDGAIVRVYEERAVEPPTPSYSVEEIIYGLIEHNALQSVKQIVGDYWELFTMRDAIAADNEIWAAQFPALKAAIVASGALTEDEIAAIITEAEVGV